MGADGEEVKYATRLARQSLLRIGIFVAILLALLAAERFHFQASINEASARLAQAAKIRGDILLADEKLTMSAYTYAHSGEEAMHKRYLEAIPEIDGAIAEAKKLASPAAATRFDNGTRVANDRACKTGNEILRARCPAPHGRGRQYFHHPWLSEQQTGSRGRFRPVSCVHWTRK